MRLKVQAHMLGGAGGLGDDGHDKAGARMVVGADEDEGFGLPALLDEDLPQEEAQLCQCQGVAEQRLRAQALGMSWCTVQ